MVDFNGPWSKDLRSLQRSVQQMPSQYKTPFSNASKSVLEKICDATALHVWESDSDIDSLLQLTSVVVTLFSLGLRQDKNPSANNGTMVIIAEGSSQVNHFSRICQLIQHITSFSEKRHLEGTVAVYGSIIIVKGWNNSHRSDSRRASGEASKVVKRIDTSIERAFSMHKSANAKKRLVWHHGSTVQFLLHWINNTSSTLRNTLHGVTITGSLDLVNGVKASHHGRGNSLNDMRTLETYGKRLGIPVTFLDSASQLISAPHLSSFLYYYAYYISVIIPPAVLKPHVYKAQDEVVTFAYRVLGAAHGNYGAMVVSAAKAHLDAEKAKVWANSTINAASYEKSKCKAVGNKALLYRAVLFAHGPISAFASNLLSTTDTVSSLARVFVGPAAITSSLGEYRTAMPVHFDWSSTRVRLSNAAPFHVLTTNARQTNDSITGYIQAMLYVVSGCMHKEKGAPTPLSPAMKQNWSQVITACAWACTAAQRKQLPEHVKHAVRAFLAALKHGAWAHWMVGLEGMPAATGAASSANMPGVSDAARANAAATAAYGDAQLRGTHVGNGGQALQQPPLHPAGMGYGPQQYPGRGGYTQSMGAPW